MNEQQRITPNQINHEDLALLAREDEIDLRQLFLNIWSGRGLIVGVALAFFLLVGIFFGFRFLSFAGHNSLEIQLRFTFNGAEKGLYPNKTKFQLSDIISNQVLNSVYDKFKLEESGLSQSDFISNISIRPAAINREFIDAKYKSSLESKKISQAEIEGLEQAYKLELNTASHRSAILGYTSTHQDVLSSPLIEKILFSIPDIWSDLAINQHGILDLPVISISAINISELKNEEYAIGTALIGDNIKLLQDSLDVLEKNERVALVRDPTSGLTIKDLNHQLKTFKSYRLEPLDTLITTQQAYRDLPTVKIYLSSKLQTLEDTLNQTLKKADIYKIAYTEHTQSSNNLKTGFKSNSAAKTELGDAFIGQLLKLGDEVSESKYRQELTAKQIELKLEAEDLKTEITLIKRQLTGIKRTTNTPTDNTIAARYQKTVTNFSNLTNNYDQLMTLIRTHALSNNGSLFETLNSETKITSFNKVQLKRVIIVSIIAIIIGGMIGIFITLIRSSKSKEV